MKLQNTKEVSKVKERRDSKRIMITTGVFVSVGFLAAMSFFNMKKHEKYMDSLNQAIEAGEFDNYREIYNEKLSEIDSSKFDQQFEDFYHNGKFRYQEKEYGINQLYIEKMTSGVSHLTLGINKIDFITKEDYSDEKRDIAMHFKDSTCFEKLYKTMDIEENEMELYPGLVEEYLRVWDGKKHDGVKELVAEKEAKKAYRQQYYDYEPSKGGK